MDVKRLKWINVLEQVEKEKKREHFINGGNFWKREQLLLEETPIKISMAAVMTELVRSKQRNQKKNYYTGIESNTIIKAINGYLLRMNRFITLTFTILLWNVFNTGVPPIQIIVQHKVLQKLIAITGRRGSSIIQYVYVLKIFDRILNCHEDLRDYMVDIGIVNWIWWLYFKSHHTCIQKIQKNATVLLKNLTDLNKPEISSEPIPVLIQIIVRQIEIGDYRLKKRSLKILLLILSPEYSRLTITEGLTMKISKYLRKNYTELIEQNQHKLVSRILEVMGYICCNEPVITNQIITRPLLDTISNIVIDNDPLVEEQLFELLTKICTDNPYLIRTLRENNILHNIYQNLCLDQYANIDGVLNLVYMVCGYGSFACVREIVQQNAIEPIALMTYEYQSIKALNSSFILHIISDSFPSSWFNDAKRELRINTDPSPILYPTMPFEENILKENGNKKKWFDNIPMDLLQLLFNKFLDIYSTDELLYFRGVSKCWRYNIDEVCTVRKEIKTEENWLNKEISKQNKSEYLERMLRHFPLITSLKITDNNINRDVTKAIYFGITHLNELYLNEITEMRYVDYYLIAFKFENLKVLHITKCAMDQGGFDAITHRLRELKELSLVEVGNEVVFSGISRLYNLTYLRLGLNYHIQPDMIMDEIAGGLGDKLKKLVLRLGLIDLINWELHMHKFEELNELRLCFVSFRSVDITAIRKVTTLEKLELVEFGHTMNMTTLNNCNLIPIIRCCYKLKSLSLGGNQQSIGRYNDKFILDMTMFCRGLRALYLETAGMITDTGLKSLSKLKQLKQLRLRNIAKITDNGLSKLVSLSRSLNKLQLSLTPNVKKTFIDEWIAVAQNRPKERFEICFKEETMMNIKHILPRNLRIIYE